MRRLAVVMAIFAMSGCGPTAGSGAVATPSLTPGPASAERTVQPLPSGPPVATRLDCGTGFSPAPDMVLNRFPGSAPILEVLDVSNPLKPRLMCTLIPAAGGEFGRSSHEVVFWMDNTIGLADLAAGTVTAIGEVPQGAFVGAYSPRQGLVAYRVPGDGDGFTMHLFQVGGHDRTLYAQQPIGGHGGSPCGPNGQLQFSPDGTELLDYSMFRPMSDPPNLLLFKSDGSRIFQQSGQTFGLWAPTGSVLYFGVAGPQGFISEIDSIDGTGQRTAIVTGLRFVCWPVMAPDGRSVVFDAYDMSAPSQATGGLPHLWRVDLATRSTSQLTTAITSRPVFVGRDVVWTSEEKPCDCGPGGASATDGVVLAHDLVKGIETKVDMSLTVPGIGLSAQPMGYDVLDGWFS